MKDPFASHAKSANAPADTAFAISPNDATPLPQVTRAIYVGQSGNIAARLAAGSEVLFENVQAGTVMPLRATDIRATGTTASSLVGLL